MELHLPTIDWYLPKATPAGKTIQIQYGVQVVTAVNSISLDGGTETSSFRLGIY
jgi:hypothetical protein